MGYEKGMKLKEEERGYRSIGKVVCPDCVYDEFLRQLIVDHGVTEGQCDYCSGSPGTHSVLSVDVLMPYVADALCREFADPYEANAPRDEGTFQIPTFPTEQALFLLGLDCDWSLLNDIADAFLHTEWVLASGGSWMNQQVHEELSSLWDEFVQSIKHQTRFFFREGTSAESPQPHQILDQIGALVESTGLIRRIETGQQLYRCRLRNPSDEWTPDGKQLSAPPQSKARAGRMNPAGIAYLYTAFERSTALAEVVERPPFDVAIGQFQNNRPLNVVDLSNLPVAPSPFDESKLEERQKLLFLRRFAEEISHPVNKDGAEHIDYVPSQVVCEYFAQVIKSYGQDNLPIDGLAYPSAVMPSGRNLVLFPTERGFETTFDHVCFIDGEVVRVDHWQDLIEQYRRT